MSWLRKDVEGGSRGTIAVRLPNFFTRSMEAFTRPPPKKNLCFDHDWNKVKVLKEMCSSFCMFSARAALTVYLSICYSGRL